MERIYRYRMTTTSGGNLSIREPNGDIWITPARIDKGGLKREDIVCVHTDGTVTGPHRPSSEFPFHKAIYDRRPDLHGLVHAHPVALVAFSICGAVPDTRIFHQSRGVCGEVGFAPYALPGSETLGSNIAKAMSPGTDCVVLENHGVVVGGENLGAAFQRFETLEFTAKTLIKAGQIGKARPLNEEQLNLPAQTRPPLKSFRAPEPDSREKELRRTLETFVRRGYQQRLLISTEGSFSARLEGNRFLITPYRVDRSTLTAADLVLVDGDCAEDGKIPSRAVRNHLAIYQRHPGIGAVVNAYTVNATAFSITGEIFDARTIPEAYLFLRDVPRIPYGLQFTDPAALAEATGPECPILLMENDGVLVAGQDVLDAFDRLEVMESTAEALINAQPIGTVRPMPEAVIQELRQAFLGD